MKVRKWILECAHKCKTRGEFYARVREHIRKSSYKDCTVKAIQRECDYVAYGWRG